MKKILILAHYYIPDTASTGQILKDLAEGLKTDFEVTVLCVVPSYLGKVAPEYKTKKVYFEEINGVKVVRLRVPEFDKTNKISRVKNILAYYMGAKKAIRKLGDFDIVYTISQPPILGGMLGKYAKKKKKAKFVYNIQDFNPEQTKAVSYSKSKLITNAMMHFDKKSCKAADKVIVVGRDMLDTLSARFPKGNGPKAEFINNWTDDKGIVPLPKADGRVQEFLSDNGLQGKFVLMYSGNIGLYYDLENLLNAANDLAKEKGEPLKAADGRELAIVFVGAGSRLNALKELAGKLEFKNVYFLPYQKQEDLVVSLNAADAHLCVNAKGIKGVSVPSKLYGIMAAGKPVLAVLEEGSEAACLVKESGCGLSCEPQDYEGFKKQLAALIETDSAQLLAMGKGGRTLLDESLTKDKAIEKYRRSLLGLVSDHE